MTRLGINAGRPIVEILIIVAGILIALGLDNWNDRRIERNLESQYLERLLEEVSRNVATVEAISRLANDKVDPLSSVDAILRQPRESRSMTDHATIIIDLMKELQPQIEELETTLRQAIG